MKEHLTEIKKYPGNLKELADEIGFLRYKETAEFLEYLKENIKEQSVADFKRDRKKLSQRLEECSKHLENARKEMEEAWSICEPYMK